MRSWRPGRPNRISLIVVLACIGALTAACAGSSGSQGGTSSPTQSDSGWSFTDARGVTVHLDQKPQRIAMWQDNAAALWDYGIRPAATWGWQPLKEHAALTGEDVSGIQDITEDPATYNVDLEKFASLKPDLVVTYNYVPPVGKETCCWRSQEEEDAVTAIAPWVALGPSDAQNRQSDNLEWHRAFAESLGAADTPESQQVTADYQAAVEAVKAAAAANPDVRVLGMSATDSLLYLANPQKESNWDFQDYLAWGLNLTGPTSSEATTDYDGWYEDSSWENAKTKIDGQYGADVLLLDARSAEPQQAVEANPVWQTVNAVKAGQVGTWYLTGMTRLKLWTEHLQELAALVQSAHRVN